MSNLVRHAEIELKAAGLTDAGDDYDGKIAADVLELVRVFAAQRHSGASAGMALAIFSKVAAFEPLVPLTGADDEWMEVGNGVFQNKRCSHVFKQHGKPYDINIEGRPILTFPYTPATS